MAKSNIIRILKTLGYSLCFVVMRTDKWEYVSVSRIWFPNMFLDWIVLHSFITGFLIQCLRWKRKNILYWQRIKSRCTPRSQAHVLTYICMLWRTISEPKSDLYSLIVGGLVGFAYKNNVWCVNCCWVSPLSSYVLCVYFMGLFKVECGAISRPRLHWFLHP